MRNMLDDFGDEHDIEAFLKAQFEDVAGRIVNRAALVLELHVVGEVGAQVVPRHLVAEFGQREREISLRGGDIEPLRRRPGGTLN